MMNKLAVLCVAVCALAAIGGAAADDDDEQDVPRYVKLNEGLKFKLKYMESRGAQLRRDVADYTRYVNLLRDDVERERAKVHECRAGLAAAAVSAQGEAARQQTGRIIEANKAAVASARQRQEQCHKELHTLVLRQILSDKDSEALGRQLENCRSRADRKEVSH